MKKLLSLLLTAALTLSLTACSGGGAAEPTLNEDGEFVFQNRIEITVPAGEGGGLDTTVRKFATYLSAELGQDVVITNKSGGSGVTAFTAAHNGKNDGYAFQFTAPSAIIAAAQGNYTFDLMAEIKPVSGLVMAEGMIFANKDLPYKTAEEMIEYAKANPGEVSIAVDTPNGITGAVITEFENATGVEFQWITSESGEDAISVIAGDIDLCLNTWGDTGAYAESGDLIPLVTMADQRNSTYDHVPSSGELGYDMELGYYRVFTAMGETPQEAIDTFGAAVHKVATENTEWIEWINQNGMTNDNLWTAEELGTILQNTYDSAAALSQ